MSGVFHNTLSPQSIPRILENPVVTEISYNQVSTSDCVHLETSEFSNFLSERGVVSVNNI